MPAKTHGERLDRLERVVQIIAEDQLTFEKNQLALQKLIANLARETRRGFDRAAKQSEENAKRFKETDERFQQTGERIDKLVIAIGALIASKPPAQG